MPTFDPDTFMQQNVDAPLSTEYELCPQGEYPAMIGDFTRDAFRSHDFEYKKGPNAGQPGTMTVFSCPFVINDDSVRQALERDTVTVFQDVVLDIGDDGGLDFGKGKNVPLGRIREAVGQNGNGPWQVASLRGAGPVMVKVSHDTFKRKDGTEGTKAIVSRVVALR